MPLPPGSLSYGRDASARKPGGMHFVLKKYLKDKGKMAGTTGLEPATSDVTGRRSNQLNYVPALWTFSM